MIAEIILLEDQSQPFPSPSPNGVTDTQKTFNAAGDDAEGLCQALRRRKELSVTDVQHFTEKYKSGFSLKPFRI